VGISIWGNADSHVIAFNEIQGGEVGILADSRAGFPDAIVNCSFLENTIRDTSEDGITSYGCQYCVFASNIIVGYGGNGIAFYGTDLCLVRYNEIRNNEVGVYHESGFENAFYGNLLHNNNIDAIDHETEFDNVWDDGAGIGNCWTYSGTRSQIYIDGQAGNVDHFPLVTEETDLARPTIASTRDFLTESSNNATIFWVAWSGPGTYSLLMDGTELQTGLWGGSGGFRHEFYAGTSDSFNFTFAIGDETGETAADTVVVTVLISPGNIQLAAYFSVGLMIAAVIILEIAETRGSPSLRAGRCGSSGAMR
jgi:hypothetical protein